MSESKMKEAEDVFEAEVKSNGIKEEDEFQVLRDECITKRCVYENKNQSHHLNLIDRLAERV